MEKIISYTRPDGRTSNANLVEPAQKSSAPGIVVIQEWWGSTIR
jgi:carboxymethylenebutenolidase